MNFLPDLKKWLLRLDPCEVNQISPLCLARCRAQSLFGGSRSSHFLDVLPTPNCGGRFPPQVGVKNKNLWSQSCLFPFISLQEDQRLQQLWKAVQASTPSSEYHMTLYTHTHGIALWIYYVTDTGTEGLQDWEASQCSHNTFLIRSESLYGHLCPGSWCQGPGATSPTLISWRPETLLRTHLCLSASKSETRECFCVSSAQIFIRLPLSLLKSWYALDINRIKHYGIIMFYHYSFFPLTFHIPSCTTKTISESTNSAFSANKHFKPKTFLCLWLLTWQCSQRLVGCFPI